MAVQALLVKTLPTELAVQAVLVLRHLSQDHLFTVLAAAAEQARTDKALAAMVVAVLLASTGERQVLTIQAAAVAAGLRVGLAALAVPVLLSSAIVSKHKVTHGTLCPT